MYCNRQKMVESSANNTKSNVIKFFAQKMSLPNTFQKTFPAFSQKLPKSSFGKHFNKHFFCKTCNFRSKFRQLKDAL